MPLLQTTHVFRGERPILRALLALRPPHSTLLRWLAVAGMLLSIGALHHLGGRNIGLYTFFVVPCIYAGWSIGRSAGLLAAALSTGVGMASDLVTHVGALLMDLAGNAVLRICVYALIAWGADTIGDLLQRLDEQSRIDALTGLANRREFLDRGKEELERARRSRRPFSVLFVDIDNFKAVNDTLGHAEGDALLRQVGGLMTSEVRSIDTPARLGGDEFAVLLPETDGKGALRIAQKLHNGLNTELGKFGLDVSASIGAAAFANVPATFDNAVKFADDLMYSIKRKSKNAVVQEDFPSSGPHPRPANPQPRAR